MNPADAAVPNSASVTLRAGMVLTMNRGHDVLTRADIIIDDGVITRIETTPDHTDTPDGPVLDCTDALVMPGLVNAHTHLPMSLFRGLADDLPLRDWLQDHIFPAEAAFITPENVSIGTALSCAEMLISGTTTCADGYFLETSVAGAVHRAGLRAVLAQGVIDARAPGVPDPEARFVPVKTLIEELRGHPTTTPAVFAHAPYTCSPDTLTRTKRFAREHGLRFFIHIAETEWERNWCLDAHGVSPVEHLYALDLLDADTVLVHAVHVDAHDADRIADSEAGIVTCTRSNMKLASGIAPLHLFLERGIPVALGTDGAASNNAQDLFRDMTATAKLQKLARETPTAVDAETICHLATVGGARVLGLEQTTGSIEPGKRADLIAVDLRATHAAPLYDPYSHLVYAASGADVRTVLVDGRVIVRDGVLTTLDTAAVCRAANALADRIRNHTRG